MGGRLQTKQAQFIVQQNYRSCKKKNYSCFSITSLIKEYLLKITSLIKKVDSRNLKVISSKHYEHPQ